MDRYLFDVYWNMHFEVLSNDIDSLGSELSLSQVDNFGFRDELVCVFELTVDLQVSELDCTYCREWRSLNSRVGDCHSW